MSPIRYSDMFCTDVLCCCTVPLSHFSQIVYSMCILSTIYLADFLGNRKERGHYATQSNSQCPYQAQHLEIAAAVIDMLLSCDV